MIIVLGEIGQALIAKIVKLSVPPLSSLAET